MKYLVFTIIRFLKVVIVITGSLVIFSKLENDNVVGVAKPKHSQMVRFVQNYIMQMRFLQFSKFDGTWPYAR